VCCRGARTSYFGLRFNPRSLTRATTLFYYYHLILASSYSSLFNRRVPLTLLQVSSECAEEDTEGGIGGSGVLPQGADAPLIGFKPNIPSPIATGKKINRSHTHTDRELPLLQVCDECAEENTEGGGGGVLPRGADALLQMCRACCLVSARALSVSNASLLLGCLHLHHNLGLTRFNPNPRGVLLRVVVCGVVLVVSSCV